MSHRSQAQHRFLALATRSVLLFLLTSSAIDHVSSQPTNPSPAPPVTTPTSVRHLSLSFSLSLSLSLSAAPLPNTLYFPFPLCASSSPSLLFLSYHRVFLACTFRCPTLTPHHSSSSLSISPYYTITATTITIMDAIFRTLIQSSPPPPDHPHDTALRSLAQRQLRAVMQTWCSPHLSNFLFSESTNVFHSDFPPHVPAGTMQTLSKFTQSPILSKSTNNALNDNHNSNSNSRKFFTPSTSPLHLPDSCFKFLFAPAATVNNVLLGYVLGEVSVNDKMSPYTDLHTNRGRSINGRFLFDGHHLIIVLHAFARGCTGILTCTWTNDGLRKRVFFVVPSAQYSFLQPPQRVTSILTINEQLQRSTLSASTHSQSSVALPNSNSSLEIDMSLLFSKLCGSFTDCSATRDDLSMHTGKPPSRTSGQMYSEMTPANASSSAALNFLFFDSYVKHRRVERVLYRSCSISARANAQQLCSCKLCEERLAPGTLSERTQLSTQSSSCSRALQIEVKNEVETIMDEMLSSSPVIEDQQAVTQANQVPCVLSPSNSSVQNTIQSETSPPPNRTLERLRERSARMAQRLREQKLEDKRRRNRVSAAKSNLKKKLRVERQERELEVLKKRKTELLAVRERLQQENEALKTRAASDVC